MPGREITWHEGELAMHALLSIPRQENPTAPGLPARYAARISASPLIALGAQDEHGRPWASIWGGERGCAGAIGRDVLAMRSAVDGAWDPVYGALWRGASAEGMITPDILAGVEGEGGERLVAGLSIDLETRDRVKFAGKILVGASLKADSEGVRDVQMGVEVSGSLGNCPKYINQKRIVTRRMEPVLQSKGLPLSEEAVGVIRRADMFFIASAFGGGGSMDVNHRGGGPGFVRVVRNDEGGVILAYPEFSGNRLYQTLGNIKTNPAVGITIPDFETSDVLYLTGTAEILAGSEAAELLHRTKLAVRITVKEARFVLSGLPYRGESMDPSPYNPPLRCLLAEEAGPYPVPGDGSDRAITARFVGREVLSPTIARITFELTSKGVMGPWKSGEAMTLDFGPELDNGYAHMRDDDPQVLNDDFVRTFTVSSPALSPGELRDADGPMRVQITVRKHGAATGLLWRYNPALPLELPVLGFGGAEGFLLPLEKSEVMSVYVAGGVGITPLLAQAGDVLETRNRLRVLWSVRGGDLSFVEDCFARIGGLAAATKIFVTGNEAGEEKRGEVEERLRGMGAEVRRRRMAQEDVQENEVLPSGGKRRFHLCAGAGMMETLLGWLEGEDVAYESFSY